MVKVPHPPTPRPPMASKASKNNFGENENKNTNEKTAVR